MSKQPSKREQRVMDWTADVFRRLGFEVTNKSPAFGEVAAVISMAHNRGLRDGESIGRKQGWTDCEKQAKRMRRHEDREPTDSFGVATAGLCQHCGVKLPELRILVTVHGDEVSVIPSHHCPHIADPDTPAPCYAEREARE